MYSGFGLGTLMLPVFALFFPVEMAVVATALVHGANNVFKVSLLGRHADREVVLKFGLTAIVAAVFGAMALAWMSRLSASMSLAVNEQVVSEVTPVKLVIGFLMIGFALFELLPRFRNLEFDRRYLPLGGLLSGFSRGDSISRWKMVRRKAAVLPVPVWAWPATSRPCSERLDAVRSRRHSHQPARVCRGRLNNAKNVDQKKKATNSLPFPVYLLCIALLHFIIIFF